MIDIPSPAISSSQPRVRYFETGEIRTIVLSLLSESPKHGYQLMKELGARLGDQRRTSAGAVYPALKQLEKEGLVEFKTKEGRHVYRLTKEGRKVVSANAPAVEIIWSRVSGVQESGVHLGPQALAIASPLREVVSAGLLAASWSNGNADREDKVRTVLREAAAKLNKLVKEAK